MDNSDVYKVLYSTSSDLEHQLNVYASLGYRIVGILQPFGSFSGRVLMERKDDLADAINYQEWRRGEIALTEAGRLAVESME